MRCLRARWPLLTTLCLLASLLVQGIASANSAAGAENRVWAFDRTEQVHVAGPRALTLKLHPGCELADYDSASDSLLAARGGAKLHPGQQGKHIPGHNNYIPGRSPLTHPNPQGLLDDFAGTGQAVNKVPRGQPGFRERVDFGQVIGEVNGQPTTKGIIHGLLEGFRAQARGEHIQEGGERPPVIYA